MYLKTIDDLARYLNELSLSERWGYGNGNGRSHEEGLEIAVEFWAQIWVPGMSQSLFTRACRDPWVALDIWDEECLRRRQARLDAARNG